ncbi:MAG: PHP domain-containing protein [Oscillospiraceae bacterium]|nr:PHP domain-containing protein [Oscillospiraceae bacterium]
MKQGEKIDLHLHTTVSDGTDSPEQIIVRVREAGIALFSVTDHDALKAGRIIPPLLAEGDPAFVTGAEFSCRDEEGKYHILGYGCDPEARPICRLVETVHSLRIRKVRTRLDVLKSQFGVDFPEEEQRRLFAMDNPGKPHIANLMVRYGYAKSRDQAFRDVLNRLRMKSEYLRPEQVIPAISESGGIPVLAHPCYGDGDQLILGEEMDGRIRRLTAFGLRGAEAFYSGFTPLLCGEILSLAAKYGLYITAGSDYHGSNKMVLLGDTGLEGETEWPEGLKRFLNDVNVIRK